MTLTTDISYDHLLELAANYNLKLQAEKKARLPFLDAATGIAQRPSTLYRDALDRLPGVFDHQVYCYRAVHWKKSKHAFAPPAFFRPESYASNLQENQTNNRDLDDVASESFSKAPDYLELDSDDSDFDDAYGSRRRKKPRSRSNRGSTWGTGASGGSRRRTGGGGATNTPSGSFHDSPFYPATPGSHQGPPTPLYYTPMDENSNPSAAPPDIRSSVTTPTQSGSFSCEICGVKYRSRTGLNYHISMRHPGMNQMHSNGGSSLPPGRGTTHSSLNALLMAEGSNDSSAPPLLTPMEDVPGGSSEDSNATHQGKMENGQVESLGIGINCDFCFGDESVNKKSGKPEAMARCCDCGRCAHFSCLQFTSNMITSVRNYRWQCIECKTCWLCGTSENDEQMLFCDDCDRGYHMYCLTPPLTDPPEGNWSCDLCVAHFHTDSKTEPSTNRTVSS